MRMKKEVEKMGKNREDIVCKDDRFKLTTYHRQPQHKAMLFNHIHGMISFLFCSFISSFMLWHTIIYRIPFVILSSSSLFAFIPRFFIRLVSVGRCLRTFSLFLYYIHSEGCDLWFVKNFESTYSLFWLVYSMAFAIFIWLATDDDDAAVVVALLCRADLTLYPFFFRHFVSRAFIFVCHTFDMPWFGCLLYTRQCVILAAFYVYSTINVY